MSRCFMWSMYLLLCSQRVTPDTEQFLQTLRARVRVGVVGGSDLNKIKEQLGEDGELNRCSTLHCASLTLSLNYYWKVVMRYASFSKMCFVRP